MYRKKERSKSAIAKRDYYKYKAAMVRKKAPSIKNYYSYSYSF